MGRASSVPLSGKANNLRHLPAFQLRAGRIKMIATKKAPLPHPAGISRKESHGGGERQALSGDLPHPQGLVSGTEGQESPFPKGKSRFTAHSKNLRNSWPRDARWAPSRKQGMLKVFLVLSGMGGGIFPPFVQFWAGGGRTYIVLLPGFQSYRIYNPSFSFEETS